MRNFPKQFNDIEKLRGAIRAARDLTAAGEDLGDDSSYGYALAQRGIYTFRGVDSRDSAALAARIAVEQGKDRAHQGVQTAAREIRRTLHLLGFLQRDTGYWQLSSTGTRLVSIPDPEDEEAKALWQDALLRLQEESIGTHAARNMLRMVSSEPGIEKKWLAFALDMNSDSQAELGRVLDLARRGEFEDALSGVGASEYTAANAVKVLPSLLQHTGLVTITGSRCRLTARGASALSVSGAAVVTGSVASPGRGRLPRGGFAVSGPQDVPPAPNRDVAPRPNEQQIHQANRLNERTKEHQELVRATIARLCNVRNIRCSADAFDILCEAAAGGFLLFEVKTVDGDGVSQARAALAQLLFYHYFDVAPIAGGSPVTRVAVFGAEPGQDARDFLAHYDVQCVVFLKSAVIVPAALEGYFTPTQVPGG